MYAVLGAKWCDSCVKLKKRLEHRDDIKFLDIDEPNAFNLFCELRLKGVKKIPTILKYVDKNVIVIKEEDL